MPTSRQDAVQNWIQSRHLHEERLLHHPSFLIRRAFQISSALFERAFEELQITPTQWSVIVSVFTFPGIDQTQVAMASALDKTSAARAIRSLIERDLIYFEVPEDDTRRRKLWLTKQGSALRLKAMQVSDGLAETIVGVLPEESRRRFIQVLREFVVAGDELSRAQLRMPQFSEK